MNIPTFCEVFQYSTFIICIENHVDETFWESMTWKYEWNDHKSQVESGNLESLVAKASLLIGKRAGYHDDGSKDCFFNNITLCYVVLILNTVKNLIVSHLDLTDVRVQRPSNLLQPSLVALA
jgi:hypothetical protein